MFYFRTLNEINVQVLLSIRVWVTHQISSTYVWIVYFYKVQWLLNSYTPKACQVPKGNKTNTEHSLLSSSQFNQGDYTVSQVKTRHDKVVDGLRRIYGLVSPLALLLVSLLIHPLPVNHLLKSNIHIL